MTEIRWDGVSLSYPGRTDALRHLSLQVPSGIWATVVGPTGCGKTSALRVLAGLERPTCGEVYLGGRRVTDDPPWSRNVAMAFQDDALLPQRSVAENLSLGAALRTRKPWWRARGSQRRAGAPSAASALTVEQVARQFGLAHLWERRPVELSGGERRRVALAQTVACHAAVTLLDEPLSNLDAATRELLRQALRQWHAQQPGTVVLVTHDQADALALGQQVCVLANGELQQQGTAQEVYERPQRLFVAGFLGNPPMNLWRGNVRDESGKRWFVAENWRVPAPNAPQGLAGATGWLGIRPEAFGLQSATRGGADEGQRATAAGQVESVEYYGDHTVLDIVWSESITEDTTKVDTTKSSQPTFLELAEENHHQVPVMSPGRARVKAPCGEAWQAGQQIVLSWSVASYHWFDAHGSRVEAD